MTLSALSAREHSAPSNRPLTSTSQGRGRTFSAARDQHDVVILPGDDLLRVFGNLGEMLATAATGRDAPTLAAIAQVVAGARNLLNLEFAWAAG